jgi:hypothetical protein
VAGAVVALCPLIELAVLSTGKWEQIRAFAKARSRIGAGPQLLIQSIRKILLGVASYAVAIAVREVADREATAVYIIAGVIVFMALIADEYYTAIRPAKTIIELAPIALDGLTEPLLLQLKTNGASARINLMMPCRTWRWLWCRRYFRMRWSKGMQNHPDVNISFPIRYGVTGACYRNRLPVYADATAIGAFSIPDKIRRQTPDLTVIFAYPIYEPARQGRPQSGRVIGVLNLDSYAVNAYNVFMVAFDQVHDVMQNVATIAARFYE